MKFLEISSEESPEEITKRNSWINNGTNFLNVGERASGANLLILLDESPEGSPENIPYGSTEEFLMETPKGTSDEILRRSRCRNR